MNIQLGQPGRKNRAFNIRIDDFDVWSLDDTLANIIHPALIRLKSRVKHFGYTTPYEETDLFAQHDIQGSFDFFDWNRQTKGEGIDSLFNQCVKECIGSSGDSLESK